MKPRRRIRKKLRIKDFAEYGCEVRIALRSWEDGPDDPFWDEFIPFVESRTLFVGGGVWGGIWSVFMTGDHRQSVTEADRAAVAAWLEAHPDVTEFLLGPLEDAWYPRRKERAPAPAVDAWDEAHPRRPRERCGQSHRKV